MEIDQLIKDIRNGDENKFEIIVNLYQQKIFKYCWCMIGNEHEAEDTVQDIFVKVFSQLYKYKVDTSFQSWLYRIAYNQCIDVLRRKKRVHMFQYIEDILSRENIIMEDNSERNYSIHDALKKLSVNERNIILLKILENKSYEEISVILQKNPIALRKQFERAKNKLKKLLKEELYNEQQFQY
jgi:RNA polymerase sigma-70 factor (ECF subfamily)